MKKLMTLVTVLMAFALPASGRAWKPQGPAAAQDYSIIIDTRPNHEVVQVFWMAWPGIPSASPVVRQLLDRYVIVALEHHHQEIDGKIVYIKDESAEALDATGTPLVELPDGRYPPAIAAAVTAAGTMLRQNLGAMGEGMKLVVFESGNVRACAKGGLEIRYAGETYVYDTPIPGCPVE